MIRPRKTAKHISPGKRKPKTVCFNPFSGPTGIHRGILKVEQERHLWLLNKGFADRRKNPGIKKLSQETILVRVIWHKKKLKKVNFSNS